MGKRIKIAFNEKMEVEFREINTSNNEIISTKTPLEMGLWREKEFIILFKRIALNPQTMLNISAWFAQKVLYRTPNRDGFDYHYFYYEKGFSVPCCRVLDVRMGQLTGLTFQVSPSDETLTKKVGAAKRLSNEQVKKAMIDKTFNGIPVLGTFDEDGLGERV